MIPVVCVKRLFTPVTCLTHAVVLLQVPNYGYVTTSNCGDIMRALEDNNLGAAPTDLSCKLLRAAQVSCIFTYTCPLACVSDYLCKGSQLIALPSSQ